jgi:hypothetical protein
VTELGSIEDNSQETARDDSGDGKGDEPSTVDPGNHAPVDGLVVSGAETDTDGGTSDALSGGAK